MIATFRPPSNATHDPLCPAGYRLLVQALEHSTESEFREWLCRVFGATKGDAAKIVAGFCMPCYWNGKKQSDVPEWIDDGFRAYLPLKHEPRPAPRG